MNHILKFFHRSLKSINCKNLTIIGGLFICISNTFAQNTTIVFKTKENSPIRINKEIDNTSTQILLDGIKTDATGNYIYSWDVNKFEFITCVFHDGGITYFPIKEGSRLTITYKGDHEFEFEGTDKAEMEYYRNGRLNNIMHPYLNSLFNLPAETSFEDFVSLIEKYNSELSNTLDSLVTKKTISPQFSDIVKNEFLIVIACTAIDVCKSRFLDNSETDANKFINGILDKISPMIASGEILKQPSGRSALAIYYYNKYKDLDDSEKERLRYENTWANHLSPNKLGYLIAPEEIQYRLLSLELLDNYENAVIRGDSTFINRISEIRPESAFLPYIKEKRNELLLSMNADISGVKYIEDTINTLEDLCKVPDFNQKILFIDLWATWCAPCIGEFKHRNKLHELLSNYKDIITVYISIDEEKDDTAWKEKTKAFNLNGYHLRANEKLVKEINEKLYDGKGIGIPLYILLDKNGNILEKNLPRPSNMDKLKEELNKHFD